MKSENVVQFEETKRSLKHNDRLAISIGYSRFESNWKNKSLSWSALLDRLEKSTTTGETHADYMKLSKEQQDRIKDIGGFVGGHLKEGKRKNGYVERRQLLTLDLDFAPTNLWEQLEDNFDIDFALCLHSTHKHSPTSPRYRLVAPIDRAVTPDEYEAIARKVAEKIGINWFDDTTFQPARLMYWPSNSSDVEPYFRYADRPFLRADEILSEYEDWTDASYWPESDRVKTDRKRQADKQGDPLEKKGAIGAFCRTYTISMVIDKFLSDVYAATGKGDRYSYLLGSTSGGLVVYGDDRWAYSNHGTDPCSGQLCNAFDLVRIHKFGHLDDNTKPGTPSIRMPSYVAMQEFILSDTDTKMTLIHEKRQEASEDFSEPVAAENNDTWKVQLEISKSGEIKPSAANLYLILENDPNLRGIKYNELERGIEAPVKMPWTRENKYWSDVDDAGLFIYLVHEYGIEAPDRIITKSLTKAASEHRINPLRDFINDLPEWDGVERVDTLFISYLAAEDTPYIRSVTRKTMIGAIARVLKPGCKFDTVTVLDGPPGIGKSTILRTLGGKWFSDNLSLADTRDKTAAEKLQGVWIMEIGEMQGTRKADVDILKSFLSRQVDEYRPAYGRNLERHPRTCIICGTTNSTTGFLQDITGNRRFWPVPVNGRGEKSVWDITEYERLQIWSEAKMRYEEGETPYLDAEMEKEAAIMQQEALEYDDREGLVMDYLDTLLPEDWYSRETAKRVDYFQQMDELDPVSSGTMQRKEVSALEIFCECFGKPRNAWRRTDTYEIGKIMARMKGWTKTGKVLRIPGYGTQRIYERT